MGVELNLFIPKNEQGFLVLIKSCARFPLLVMFVPLGLGGTGYMGYVCNLYAYTPQINGWVENSTSIEGFSSKSYLPVSWALNTDLAKWYIVCFWVGSLWQMCAPLSFHLSAAVKDACYTPEKVRCILRGVRGKVGITVSRRMSLVTCKHGHDAWSPRLQQQAVCSCSGKFLRALVISYVGSRRTLMM